MAQISFGRLIAEKRKTRRLTQEDVAAVLGMTRANYSQLETGKRKDVLDPERTIKLARLLEVEVLDLVIGMGYPLRLPQIEDSKDLSLIRAYHEASPATQDFVRRGLGLES